MNLDLLGSGMLAHVPQRLLGDAEQQDPGLARGLLLEVVLELELQIALELCHVLPQGRGQPLVLQDGRMELEDHVPQAEDRGPDRFQQLVQGRADVGVLHLLADEL